MRSQFDIGYIQADLIWPAKTKKALVLSAFLEATPGLEPGIKVLQTSALPLGYVAVYFRYNYMHQVQPLAAKPFYAGADYGARTRHLDLGKVALYQMS